MIKEIQDFKRQDLFNNYHSFTNPFVFFTIELDVTNIVNYCKKHKNFYATLGFLITKTVNQIDAFKYRYKDGKIFFCDEVKSNYTQMYSEDAIGYFTLPATENFDEYINNFLKIQKKFMEEKTYTPSNNFDEIWLSCQPWFSFTGFVPVFNKECSIPQFIWDKYENVDGKYKLHLMIMVHHGFADGSHIGKFIDLLNKNINLFN